MVKVVYNVSDIQNQKHDSSQVYEPAIFLRCRLATEQRDVLDLAGNKSQTGFELFVFLIFIKNGLNTCFRCFDRREIFFPLFLRAIKRDLFSFFERP